MKNWVDITHEELMQEIIPGVTSLNTELINKLNYVSYLAHMGELVKMGVNHDAPLVREHFEDLLACVYVEQCRAIKEEYPTEEDVDDYMKLPGTHDAIDRLVMITIQLTPENWPSFKDRFCKENGLDPTEFD